MKINWAQNKKLLNDKNDNKIMLRTLPKCPKHDQAKRVYLRAWKWGDSVSWELAEEEDIMEKMV